MPWTFACCLPPPFFLPHAPHPFFLPAFVVCFLLPSSILFFFRCCAPPFVLHCAVLEWFACPWSWAVLVCIGDSVVPRWGPVCAYAVLFNAPWLCLFSGCCCLSCCVCPMAAFLLPVFAPVACCLWCPACVLCPLLLVCGACGLWLPLAAVVGSPLSGFVVLSRLVLVYVVLVCLVWCFAPFWDAVLCPPPLLPRVLCAVLCYVGCGLVLFPPTGCGALCCAVSCVLSCGAAVCGVACSAFCLVLGGVLVLGVVLALVLMCPSCCGLLLCAVVFSRVSFFRRCSLPSPGALGCFCLCGAVPWCVLLFGVALLRCVLVLVSAALCWLVLCCAVVCLLVLCCVVCFVAVLLSHLASPAAVAGCCALSLGAVLCSPALLPVVWVLSFLVLCFLGPLVSCSLLCGAVLARLHRCFLCDALSPVWHWLVLCLVACCCRVFGAHVEEVDGSNARDTTPCVG